MNIPMPTENRQRLVWPCVALLRRLLRQHAVTVFG